MTIRKQASAIVQMERESLKAVDQIAEQGARVINLLWEQTRDSLQSLILHEYRRDFGKGKWDVTMASAKGTLTRIEHAVYAVLEDFRRESAKVAEDAFEDVYRESALRWAWIIDSTTPPNITTNLPRAAMFREATSNIKVYKGPAAETAWKVRWSSWAGAYASALTQNIKLGAMGGSSADDAADEVDQTRAGSPASSLFEALDRVYWHQSVSVQAMAQRDLAEANPAMELEEIWNTREDARVCDDCDRNAGRTREKAYGDIPLHPRCNCYWRLVPASWADLLRTGNEDDRELARAMDAKGLVPSSMVIRDRKGRAVAATMISFKQWAKRLPLSITSK